MASVSKGEAIEQAWKQIQGYVKDNYIHVFPQEIEFMWRTDERYRFGVTPEGDAFFVKYWHEGDKLETRYYFHPYKSKGYMAWVWYGQEMERIVRDWPTIKKILRDRAEEEDRIYNFHV